MARPLKIGADYFPLDVNLDGKFERIEAKYGNDGFAAVIKLYQEVFKEGYYLQLDDESLFVFAKRFGVEYSKIENIINDCLKYNIFDISLKTKYDILTSSGIQKRYFKIMERRKSITFIREYLLVDLEEISNDKSKAKIIYFSLEKGKIEGETINDDNNGDSTGVNVNNNGDSDELTLALSTETKLNQIKLEESKLKQTETENPAQFAQFALSAFSIFSFNCKDKNVSLTKEEVISLINEFQDFDVLLYLKNYMKFIVDNPTKNPHSKNLIETIKKNIPDKAEKIDKEKYNLHKKTVIECHKIRFLCSDSEKHFILSFNEILLLISEVERLTNVKTYSLEIFLKSYRMSQDKDITFIKGFYELLGHISLHLTNDLINKFRKK